MGRGDILILSEANNLTTPTVPSLNSKKGIRAATKFDKGAIPHMLPNTRTVGWSSNLVLLAPPVFTWHFFHLVAQGFGPASLVRDLTPAVPQPLGVNMADQRYGMIPFLLDGELLCEDIGTHELGRTILKIHVSLCLRLLKDCHVNTMRTPNVS
jgi:hypothetical protein